MHREPHTTGGWDHRPPQTPVQSVYKERCQGGNEPGQNQQDLSHRLQTAQAGGKRGSILDIAASVFAPRASSARHADKMCAAQTQVCLTEIIIHEGFKIGDGEFEVVAAKVLIARSNQSHESTEYPAIQDTTPPRNRRRISTSRAYQ
mmetsp:Transcript_33265/g.61270  ORF Transcript_33265/g.61270 Transcript_33265/m.61270 type:complete len:147 (-) Transcript_33265:2671-3111(-)